MMTMMTMMMKSFLLVAIALSLSMNPLRVAAQCADVVYQSTAVMKLNIEKSTSYTVPEIYKIELETIQYLAEPLQQATTLSNNVDILNTHVSVANQLLQQPQQQQNGNSSNVGRKSRIVLDMVVAIIYIAPVDTKKQQYTLDVSTILDNVVDPHQLAMALNVPSLSATYGPKDATVALQSCDDSSSSSSSDKSAADKGLIATTVFLAIGLATLASVVLYVNGGCNGCKNWFINCLFEEVPVTGDGTEEDDEDDDDNVNLNDNNLNKNNNNVKNKSGSGAGAANAAMPTNACFQVHTYPDEESVSMSSVSLAMQTNPSGILGANHVLDENHHHHQHNNSNPATAGLGIKTPGRHLSGIIGGGDNSELMMETPLSQQQPLGITSIRKMPLQPLQLQQQNQHQQYYYHHHNQNHHQLSDASMPGGGEQDSNAAAGGGLVNMIMQRLNLNENNNKP